MDCRYNHIICNTFAQNKYLRNVGCAVHSILNSTHVLLLGKERGGLKRHHFNICTGTMEKQDGNCYKETLIRELREEYKIIITLEEFDIIFKDCVINTTPKGALPIFVGTFPIYVRSVINRILRNNINDKSVKWCEKEIECVDYFTLDKQQIEGRKTDINGYNIVFTDLVDFVIDFLNNKI